MEKKKGLSALTLKWIAVVTMLIDHTGMILAGYVPVALWRSMRIVGRLAFPIFCFLLVEGFFHTGNIKKYLMRLGIFAVISEIPFNLILSGRIFYPDYQNVFFTLFIGLLLLYLYNKFLSNVQPVYAMMTVVSMLCLGYIIKCDYGAEGILVIFFFYWFRYRPVPRVVGVSLILAFMGSIEPFAILAFLPLAFYNGKKGGKETDSGGILLFRKYFFYCFYPVHLLILWAVKCFIL